MTTRHLLGVAVLCAAACGLTADDQKQPDRTKGEAKMKLDGTYTIVSGERDGQPIPAERIKGALVKFTDRAVVGTDKDKQEFFAATYTVDTSKTPWAIRMTSTMRGDAKDKEEKKEAEKGKSDKPDEAKKTTAGLIKQDGDTVTIVYALPGGETPTDFKAGKNQHLFVMKPEKKGER